MLNLSDKELDRLSREAAQEHDPGDVLGPQAWDRLEWRLDRELGRVGSNPIRGRGFRRFPFYYAPAILLILSVTYYLIRPHQPGKTGPSGSPPVAAAQASSPATTLTQPVSSTQNPDHNDKSTSTLNNDSLATEPTTPRAAPTTGAASSTTRVAPSATGAATTTTGATTSANAGTRSSTGTGSAITHVNAPSGNHTARVNSAANASTRIAPAPAHATTTGNFRSSRVASGNSHRTSPSGTIANSRNRSHGKTGSPTHEPLSKPAGHDPQTIAGAADISNLTAPAHSRDLVLTNIQRARSMRRTPAINDSFLRAYQVPTPIQPGKHKMLYINRRLRLGFTLAPDFSSVNSLAGDRPGSSFGLTVDYQFANRWYISSGLLASRKNYAARGQDFKVPYQVVLATAMRDIDFVKGSMYTLEVPLNLRYDFSVTGNTLFFASGGVSSYLLSDENCDYYYNFFNREESRGFKYPWQNNYLFSSFNLSLGVETGISNSLSLLVAPYMKIPARHVGIGQMQLNSVGINFAIKFAPVLSRRRR